MSRHLDRWLPGPFAPGWTRLFEVIMPGPEMRHIDEAGVAGKLHHRLECPDEESVHVILLAARAEQDDPASLRMRKGAHLATCALGDQTDLVIVAMLALWGPGEAAAVEADRDAASPKAPTRIGQPAPSELTRMPMFGRNVDGRRFVIDAAGLACTAGEDARP